MCVCLKHLITFSAFRREDNENIMKLLIIDLENEIWLGAGRGVVLKLRGLFSC